MRDRVHDAVLGNQTDAFLRKWAINLAIVGFLLHLVACTIYNLTGGFLEGTAPFVDSYLDALYTPFSIILAYEVYELIKAIPESFSNSIGKQFEVITLLVVRDIFKNLADINATAASTVDSDVAFVATEALAFVVLFTTALYFRSTTQGGNEGELQDDAVKMFVMQKKDLACALAVAYVCVAVYSITSWSYGVLEGDNDLSRTVFFANFFTLLILSDIIILLVSYKHITDFPQLARNTGFVLSTVVVRVGIATPGFTGAVLFILSAVLASVVLKLSILSEDKAEPSPVEANPV